MSEAKIRIYVSGIEARSETELYGLIAEQFEISAEDIELRRYENTVVVLLPRETIDPKGLDETVYQLRRHGLQAQKFQR